MLLYIIDLICIVCVFTLRNKGHPKKKLIEDFREMFSRMARFLQIWSQCDLCELLQTNENGLLPMHHSCKYLDDLESTLKWIRKKIHRMEEIRIKASKQFMSIHWLQEKVHNNWSLRCLSLFLAACPNMCLRTFIPLVNSGTTIWGRSLKCRRPKCWKNCWKCRINFTKPAWAGVRW
jgi:hypothetical protein